MAENVIMERVKYLKVVKFFVEMTWYLFWLAIAIAMALLIAGTVFDFQIKYIQIPVEVTFHNLSENPLNSVDSELPVVGFFNPRVSIENTDFQNLFYLIPLLLLFGLQLIVFQVRKFLGTVEKGSPFIEENPKRIKIIGMIIVFGAPIIGIANYVYASYYRSFLNIPGAEIDIIKSFDPIYFMIGLVILVIGKVFEAGVKLQTDHDLTV